MLVEVCLDGFMMFDIYCFVFVDGLFVVCDGVEICVVYGDGIGV